MAIKIVVDIVDDLSSVALAQYDVEVRFQVLAGKGNAAQGLRLLDKLDRAFDGKSGPK